VRMYLVYFGLLVIAPFLFAVQVGSTINTVSGASVTLSIDHATVVRPATPGIPLLTTSLQSPAKEGKRVSFGVGWKFFFGIPMDIFKFCSGLVLLVLLWYLCRVLVREYRREVIMIEPFEVSEELAKKGYNGRVVANRLMAKISDTIQTAGKEIRRITDSKDHLQLADSYTPTWLQDSPDVTVSGFGFSPRKAITYVKDVLKCGPKRISGEVVLHRNSVTITVRVRGIYEKGIREESFKGSILQLDDLTGKAARFACQWCGHAYILAYYFYNRDEIKEMEKSISFSLAHDASGYRFYISLLEGKLLIDDSRYDEGIQRFNEILQGLKAKKKRASVFFYRAECYWKKKNIPKALSDCNASIECFRYNAVTYNNRAILFCEMEKWQKAKKDFDQALKLSTEYIDAYYGRGICFYEMEKYKEALVDFNQALALNPAHSNPYYGRGLLYLEIDEREKAKADFLVVCEISSNMRQREIAQQLLYELDSK
jgi:tetratricopeptide (TPR) repeat protein